MVRELIVPCDHNNESPTEVFCHKLSTAAHVQPQQLALRLALAQYSIPSSIAADSHVAPHLIGDSCQCECSCALQPVRSLGIGEVIASEHLGFPVHSIVRGNLEWGDYTVFELDPTGNVPLEKLDWKRDDSAIPLSWYLGVLGKRSHNDSLLVVLEHWLSRDSLASELQRLSAGMCAAWR